MLQCTDACPSLTSLNIYIPPPVHPSSSSSSLSFIVYSSPFYYIYYSLNYLDISENLTLMSD